MARHVRIPSAGRRSRLLLALSLLLVLAGAAGLGFAVLSARPPSSGAAAGTPDDAASEVTASAAAASGAAPGAVSDVASGAASQRAVRGTDWVELLARLDARRARAFSAGNPDALREVYADGSAALRADRRLLRRYADRGLRVRGLRMRVVDVRLLEAGERHAVLRVRDRVAGGRVVDGNDVDRAPDDTGRALGDVGRALGDDTWSRHRIRLERGDDGWQIAKLELLD